MKFLDDCYKCLSDCCEGLKDSLKACYRKCCSKPSNRIQPGPAVQSGNEGAVTGANNSNANRASEREEIETGRAAERVEIKAKSERKVEEIQVAGEITGESNFSVERQETQFSPEPSDPDALNYRLIAAVTKLANGTYIKKKGVSQAKEVQGTIVQMPVIQTPIAPNQTQIFRAQPPLSSTMGTTVQASTVFQSDIDVDITVKGSVLRD